LELMDLEVVESGMDGRMITREMVMGQHATMEMGWSWWECNGPKARRAGNGAVIGSFGGRKGGCDTIRGWRCNCRQAGGAGFRLVRGGPLVVNLFGRNNVACLVSSWAVSGFHHVFSFLLPASTSLRPLVLVGSWLDELWVDFLFVFVGYDALPFALWHSSIPFLRCVGRLLVVVEWDMEKLR